MAAGPVAGVVVRTQRLLKLPADLRGGEQIGKTQMNAFDGAGLTLQPGGVLVGHIGIKTVHLGPRPETPDHGEALEARHHPGRGHTRLR